MAEISFEQIFEVMSRASHGDAAARVELPKVHSEDDFPTRFALALNVVLDDRASQVKAAERMAERLRILAEASHEFSAVTLDQHRLLDTVARTLATSVGDFCALLLESSSGALDLAAAHAVDATAHEAQLSFPTPLELEPQSLVRQVYDSGEPFMASRIDLAELRTKTTSKYFEFLRLIGAHSLMIVPMRAQGRSFGSLVLIRHRAESVPFESEDLSLAHSLADHASLAITNARTFAAKRASDQRFARLADSGILGIVHASLDGRILDVNGAMCEMIGYTRTDVLDGTLRWGELTPPEWRDLDKVVVEQLASTGVGALREKEYIHRDGTRVPILVGSAMVDERVGEVISFVLDLRGSRRMQEIIAHLREARAAEATFRSFIDAAPDSAVIVDGDGKIILVNARTEEQFGYARNELIGSSVDVLVPDHVKPSHVAHRKAFAADPSLRPMGSGRILHGRRKDGTEFPVEISLGPLKTDAGMLVFASIRDVTERNRTDELRARLAAIVDASDDAIIGKTLEGIVTSWNDGARRLFGYTADEMIGQPIVRLVPADRASEEPEILARLAAGSVERFDTVRLRKDGTSVHVSVTSSPVRDSNGRPVSASKVVRDITERRRAEEALARAKDTAEAANRELEAFSYSVAHDLRAPLRGMNGFARVLLDTYGEKLDADAKDWLAEILLNAQKMAALIDALLSLARLSRSELHREPIDLSVFVRDVVRHLSTTEPHRKVDVVVRSPLIAFADPGLARVLVENLVGNAWKFSSDVAAARIEVGTTTSKGADAFFVRDNGAGFDMTYVDKLFGPFQRLHTVEEFAGTGIGLATVQRIIHRHSGRIWAEGEVGHGATFYFTFPKVAT